MSYDLHVKIICVPVYQLCAVLLVGPDSVPDCLFILNPLHLVNTKAFSPSRPLQATKPLPYCEQVHASEISCVFFNQSSVAIFNVYWSTMPVIDAQISHMYSAYFYHISKQISWRGARMRCKRGDRYGGAGRGGRGPGT